MKMRLLALVLLLALIVPTALADGMLVHIDAICYDANHVGTKWDGAFYIGGVEITDGSIVDLQPGEYTLTSVIGEYDASPEEGMWEDTYTLTTNELTQGFTASQVVTVTENKGMYKNYYAEWYVNYTFIPVAGCYVLP